ncbi:MAG: hypothetical protein M1835_003850 [Candelina submexicana]|nr:MAG: hypothetical protein M1835_003850 [Candelina submexicana]
MVSTSLTLTFGIELEFYIKVYIPKYTNADELIPLLVAADPDHRPYLRTRYLTQKVYNDIICTISDSGYKAGWSDWLDGGAWLITDDSTITVPRMPPQDTQDWIYMSAELKSPILRFDLNSLKEITEVINVITSRYSIGTNQSCGFHVHVGNSVHGFPLQTLKNFYTLAAAYENQIQSILSPDRLGNLFCVPISSCLPLSMPKKAAIIAEASSIEDFIMLVTNPLGRYTAYNLHGLVHGPFKTIEFRQHAGTMDVPAIAHWVQFVGGLVSFAHSAGPHHLLWLLHKVSENPDMQFTELLYELDMDSLMPYYLTRMHKHGPGSWQVPSVEDEKREAIRKAEEREIQERERLGMEVFIMEQRRLERLQTAYPSAQQASNDTHIEWTRTVDSERGQEETGNGHDEEQGLENKKNEQQGMHEDVDSFFKQGFGSSDDDISDEVAEMGTLTQDELDEVLGSGVGDLALRNAYRRVDQGNRATVWDLE